jgi:hypothetical protein
MRRTRDLWWLALALAACATSHPSARSEDLSADAHRREAARERMLAEQNYEQFRPTASAALPGTWSSDGPRLFPLDVYRFNPTDRALDDAQRHLQHAREHEAAAQALEQYEEQECRELPPKVRAACPMLGPVRAIEDLPDGVRIHFRDDEAVGPVLAHMRCHLAFARARAFAGVADCPLYLRGVTIAASADGRAIDVRADDAATARAVQRGSRLTTQ